MANRFPLTLNASISTIEELPSGDDLDLSGSNISNVGNIAVTGNISATGNVSVSGNVNVTTDATVGGLSVGTKIIPINTQSSAYDIVLSDNGNLLLHPTADTTPRTFTIPANSNIAFPIGTTITFVNQASAGNLSIDITDDTMRLAGNGISGTRTLAANGIATAVKLTSTEWLISGVNLT